MQANARARLSGGKPDASRPEPRLGCNKLCGRSTTAGSWRDRSGYLSTSGTLNTDTTSRKERD